MNIRRLFVIASTMFDCIVTPGVKSLLCNISLKWKSSSRYRVSVFSFINTDFMKSKSSLLK